MTGLDLRLTFGSLFSGIGGLDLGLEAAGMKCMWQVERDLYARRVLRARFPGVRLWQDVTKVGAAHLPVVDVICGGFPCQDISPANPNGKGLAGARSGLWSHFARIIGEVQPRGVLIENNGHNRARWLPVALGDLAALGLDAEWHCVRASDVGAPHERDRCFVAAWRSLPDPNRDGLRLESGRCGGARGSGAAEPQRHGCEGDVAHADGAYDARDGSARGVRAQVSGPRLADDARPSLGTVPLLPRERGVSLPAPRNARSGVLVSGGRGGRFEPVLDARWWASEPLLGRVGHGIPHRVDRLRGLGNAVVPRVGFLVAQRLHALVLQSAGRAA